jgi:hypothetical protein
MKTLAQNVEMRRLLPPEAPKRFATRKMASVGAQGGIPQIFGLCCFLDTRSAPTADNGPKRQRNGLLFRHQK